MWFHQQAGGVGVHDRKQTYQGKVTTCDKSIPKWNSGAKVTNTVYSRGSNCNREYLKNAIHQKGHAMIGMFASEPQVKDYKSGVLETCRYVFYVPLNAFYYQTNLNMFQQWLRNQPCCSGCRIWHRKWTGLLAGQELMGNQLGREWIHQNQDGNLWD